MLLLGGFSDSNTGNKLVQRFAQHCCFTSCIAMLLVLPFARSSCCATVLCQQLVVQQFLQPKTKKYWPATDCSRSFWNEQYCNVAQKAVAWICCPCNPLPPNRGLVSWFSSARSVKKCDISVLLEVHEAYFLAYTVFTVFLLLTGLYIKMLRCISKQGIFSFLCVNVVLKNVEFSFSTAGKCAYLPVNHELEVFNLHANSPDWSPNISL